MSNWINYCISAVGYSKSSKHIKKARVYEYKENVLGSSEIWSRQDIISKIEKGVIFITIYKDNDNWKRGKDVNTVEIKKIKYLRTDKNKIEEDNLGELPNI